MTWANGASGCLYRLPICPCGLLSQGWNPRYATVRLHHTDTTLEICLLNTQPSSLAVCNGKNAAAHLSAHGGRNDCSKNQQHTKNLQGIDLERRQAIYVPSTTSREFGQTPMWAVNEQHRKRMLGAERGTAKGLTVLQSLHTMIPWITYHSCVALFCSFSVACCCGNPAQRLHFCK